MAVTSDAGYTAASVEVSIAGPTTRNITNYVRLTLKSMQGAQWYHVFCKVGAGGSYQYIGACQANPHPSANRTQNYPIRFDDKGGGGVSSPEGLPTTPPGSAGVNALRTRIVSGSGTTTVTLEHEPATTASGLTIVHCNVLPFRAAIEALNSTQSSSKGGNLYAPSGTYRFTADLVIDRSVKLSTAGGHGDSPATSFQFVDGYGVRCDDARTGQVFVPGGRYAIGDKVLPSPVQYPRARLATTANIVLDNTTTTVDGKTVANGDRIFVGMNQTNGAERGVWVASTSGAWTRATDFDSAAGVQERVRVCITDGNTLVNKIYELRNAAPFVIGTDALTFTEAVGSVIYRVTAITTGYAGSEPMWPQTNGNTIVSTGVTFTCDTTGQRTSKWFSFEPFEITSITATRPANWVNTRTIPADDAQESALSAYGYKEGAAFLQIALGNTDGLKVTSCGSSGLVAYGSIWLGGNADNSHHKQTRVILCTGSGVVATGGEANKIVFDHPDIVSCTGSAGVDDSFLGCTWRDPHCAGCVAGSFLNSNNSTQSSCSWINPYTESGTNPACDFFYPAAVVAGTHGSGISTRSNALMFLNSSDVRAFDVTSPNNAAQLRLRFMAASTSAIQMWVTDADAADSRIEWNTTDKAWDWNVGGTVANRFVRWFAQNLRGAGILQFPNGLLTTTGKKWFWSASIPTSGIYDVGDFIWDTSGSVVGRIGWIATTKCGATATGWAASTAKRTGDFIVPSGDSANVYVCSGYSTTTAKTGTTGGTQPGTWNSGTTTDNTVTWARWGPSTLSLQEVYSDAVSRAVADLTALKAIGAAQRYAGARVSVVSPLSTWTFDSSLTSADPNEGVSCLSASGSGGWRRSASDPAFTGTFHSTSATASVLKNIALPDNTTARVVVVVVARDTGGNYYKKKSSTEWTRSAGGGATQLGTDDGPAAVDNITVTGASVVANGNGIDVKYGGSGSVHSDGTYEIFYELIATPAAT